jgi:ABC-type amino acid transport substrate-binding protein
MKKFLIWSGIAILAITSCAKDQTTEVNNGHAIGFRAGETELTNKVNDAIKALIDNGTAAEISNDWFGKDIVVFEATYEE